MYYFAYGSNLDEKQMVFRCPEARFVGIALLENHRFIINDRGVATVITDAASVVHGTVWELNETDLKSMDAFEGVQERLYDRKTVSVILAKTVLGNVLIYAATDSKPGLPRKNYMEKIIKAAIGYNFPADYIDQLKTWTKKK
ncbi:MAG: hypothetical protein A2161_11915 [Candidatus Schekmanbacteria bacterium RBG_13_48_7]|uniref:Gamma-glutamylcyclotransferase AIG2-like domain-containing protein n=1 Tax=Candidatus Schekmanbacteria bacterium RBG_13_48_7 TaxID=1817878 RepID=A0A1F7S101_9BACT|nr:MAG: hypothetical protein A2161_11915 [Candidatus Schekmanbacteria bacterium RBG_13_48_7]